MTDEGRVGAAGAAAIMGIKRTSWGALVSAKRRLRSGAPTPDGHEEISGHPWWYVSTVERYRDSRPGQGFRTDRCA
jgi:hypothetical protein